MEEVAEEDDIVFRIGGDEFVMLTNSTDESKAREKMEKLLSKNGECISFEGKQIPLSLYGSIVRLGRKTMHYSELFTALWESIEASK